MEKPSLYQIKWRRDKKKWNYGIVEEFGKEIDDAWESSHALWVSDAISPDGNWVYYDKDEIEAINCMDDEFIQYVADELIKAQEQSKNAIGLVGKMFSVGVADGHAYYVVVKENKKTVKIEWRGFCIDRYTDQILGFGGLFPKDRIEDIIQGQENMTALFEKCRE